MHNEDNVLLSHEHSQLIRAFVTVPYLFALPHVNPCWIPALYVACFVAWGALPFVCHAVVCFIAVAASGLLVSNMDVGM